MDNLNISKMRAELNNFYFSKVKNIIPEINKKRMASMINAVGFLTILLGFSLFLFFKVIPIIIIFVGFLIAFKFNKYDGNSKTKVIESADFFYKRKLMPDFLKIFGDGIYWGNINLKKIQQMLSKNLARYKFLNIMNPFFLLYPDDIIYGKYQNVPFYLMEANTAIFSFNNIVLLIMIIPLVIFLLTALGILLSVVFNVFFEINVLKFALCYILFWGVLIVYKLLIRVPFKGVIIDYDMNKRFSGHTFILERANTRRGIKFDTSKFQEVKLEDVEFMKKYIVYSDNQIEARYILTTGFIERFNNIKTAFNAQFIRAAFKDGKISISLNSGKDLFSMVDLSKDTNGETFAILFEELYSVLNLVDELKLNQHLGL